MKKILIILTVLVLFFTGWVILTHQKSKTFDNKLVAFKCEKEQLLNLKSQLLAFFNPPFSFNVDKEIPKSIIENPCLPNDFKELHLKLSGYVQERIDGRQQIREKYRQYERQNTTELDAKYINEIYNIVVEEQQKLEYGLIEKYDLKNQNKKYQELISNFLLSDVK